MKKKRLVTAICIGMVSIIFVGLNASFMGEVQAKGLTGSGPVKVELVEWAISETGQMVPFQNKTGIMPGDAVSKIVTVKNIGAEPVYVRVQVEKNMQMAADSDGEPRAEEMICNVHTNAWTKQEDFYYYNDVLAAGESTSPLFSEVVFDESMGNEYQNAIATIKITTQAVQSVNNGASALEALGWPGTFSPDTEDVASCCWLIVCMSAGSLIVLKLRNCIDV